ncbi:MAG: hypothetical protein HY898_09265 [Deltaproteobacteria bacterium]|nr:hypothetical protein [Deltaproteobacteria bacterium]
MTSRLVGVVLSCFAIAVACGGTVRQAPTELQGGAAGQGGNNPGQSGAAGTTVGGAPHGGAGGAAGTEVGGAAGTSPSCVHAIPPQPPSVTNAGGDLELVFAFTSIRFDSGADAGAHPVGFDLDLTCTCQGEGDSCVLPSWATAIGCDGPDGRDNAFASMMAEFGAVAPEFSAESWSASIAAGSWSVLLRIRNYNGQADDDEVELAWYVPLRFQPDLPKLDGSDAWRIVGTCIAPGDGGDPYSPKYFDPKAYVSNGTLVARLPKAVFRPSGWASMILTDAVVTGRLMQSAIGWEIQDGGIAAVWALNDVFAGMKHMVISASELCADPNDQVYAAVKKMLCSHADIYRLPGAPATTCDSISVGLGFETVPAVLGEIRPPEAKPDLCGPQTDPANDSCDK